VGVVEGVDVGVKRDVVVLNERRGGE